MNERSMSGVDISADSCDDHGHIDFTFGGGVTIGELADALRSAPRDAMITDVAVSYYSEEDSCNGQGIPDETHEYPVVTIGTMRDAA